MGEDRVGVLQYKPPRSRGRKGRVSTPSDNSEGTTLDDQEDEDCRSDMGSLADSADLMAELLAPAVSNETSISSKSPMASRVEATFVDFLAKMKPPEGNVTPTGLAPPGAAAASLFGNKAQSPGTCKALAGVQQHSSSLPGSHRVRHAYSQSIGLGPSFSLSAAAAAAAAAAATSSTSEKRGPPRRLSPSPQSAHMGVGRAELLNPPSSWSARSPSLLSPTCGSPRNSLAPPPSSPSGWMSCTSSARSSIRFLDLSDCSALGSSRGTMSGRSSLLSSGRSSSHSSGEELSALERELRELEASNRQQLPCPAAPTHMRHQSEISNLAPLLLSSARGLPGTRDRRASISSPSAMAAAAAAAAATASANASGAASSPPPPPCPPSPVHPEPLRGASPTAGGKTGLLQVPPPSSGRRSRNRNRNRRSQSWGGEENEDNSSSPSVSSKRRKPPTQRRLRRYNRLLRAQDRDAEGTERLDHYTHSGPRHMCQEWIQNLPPEICCASPFEDAALLPQSGLWWTSPEVSSSPEEERREGEGGRNVGPHAAEQERSGERVHSEHRNDWSTHLHSLQRQQISDALTHDPFR
mgnify:FL=1